MTPADPNPNPAPPGPTIPEPTPGPEVPTHEPPGLVPPPAPDVPLPPSPDVPTTPFPVHPEPAPTPAAPPGGPGAPVGPMAEGGAEMVQYVVASESEAVVLPPEPAPARREPAVPAQPVPGVPPAPQPHDLSRIAQDLQIRKAQVEAVVQLLDDGNTVPFITRYRKERTGGLNEEGIRRVQDRVTALRTLADRKQTILKSIAFQGKLTDDLVAAILAAEHPKRLEDLYQPYKPKKRSLASEAKEKGLEPLALAIWNRDPAVANLVEVLGGMVNPEKGLNNTAEILVGARNILAEVVADSAEVRGPLRAFLWDTGALTTKKHENLPEGKGQEYRDYFEFREPVRHIPPHRVLAVNRGEKENAIRVKMEWDAPRVKEIALNRLPLADHPHKDFLLTVVDDALERLLMPSLEREIRRELTEEAQNEAIGVFAKNLRSLLLQPPLRGKRVLAVDPGMRTGCKLAVLDETGKMLEETVVYPHPPQKRVAEAKLRLEQLVRKHQTTVIAIGNGTGCRETEQLVSDLIAELEKKRLNPTPEVPATPAVTVTADGPAAGTAVPETIVMAPAASETAIPETLTPEMAAPLMAAADAPVPDTGTLTISSDLTSVPAAAGETVAPAAAPTPAAPVVPPPPAAPAISLEGLSAAPADLAYVIVIEAGASDYSASLVAREEFPELDATTRGTISIGRRLQDPLAELVKIDPQHVGVGLYQHDVKPKHLKESLEAVIESCVNAVGVDLNTASVPLLRHVSGMNQLVAREVVTYRDRHGAFSTREQLKNVPQMGDARFTQAAGFLKIPGGADPLDTTWIHPESYDTTRQILADLGFTPADLLDREKVQALRGKLNETNLPDVARKFGAGEPTIHDIFEALARPGRDPREDLPPPIFKKGILRIEDITPGMELKGTVLNVVPFGAFVDIGLKESGLVHISQMANRYIKSPYDVVGVGDVVTVWVIEVKPGEKKISLSMIPPGQERRPQGRGFGPPREDRPPQDAPPRREFQPREFQPRADRPPPPPRQTQGAGQGQGFQPRGDRGPPPGGRRFGPSPGGRGPGGPPRGPAPAQPAGEAPAPQPAAPPPPPRKPAKPKPLPNLTSDKKTGKAPLNTFGELAALFKTRDEPPPAPPEPPKAETPPEQPPAPEAPPSA